MKNIKSVAEIKDYGKIEIHLREIMEKQGISRNQLARLTSTRFEVINKWYNGKVERIDTDILARLCFCLGCSIEEIIEYKQ